MEARQPKHTRNHDRQPMPPRYPAQDQFSTVQRPVGYRPEDGVWQTDAPMHRKPARSMPQVAMQPPVQRTQDMNAPVRPPRRRVQPTTYQQPALDRTNLRYDPAAQRTAPAVDWQPPEERSAQELLEQRSEKLYNHRDQFWQAPAAAQTDAAPKSTTTQTPAVRRRSKASRRETVKAALLVTLAVLLTIGVMDRFSFRIRDVQVTGNATMSTEAVLRQAGIRMGDSIYRLQEDEVAGRINQNRYLRFVALEKELPSTVRLTVKERTTDAVMNYCGMNYAIDRFGMVLEENGSVIDGGSVPVVSGLLIEGQNGCAVGRAIIPSSRVQMDAMTEILVELKVLQATGRIRQVVLSDTTNLLLETRQGYSVRLGNHERLHEKLKAMLRVEQDLLQKASGSGTIDVSEPKSPTFIPED